MATYLAVPLKKASDVDLIKPLKSFISNTFQLPTADEFNQPLQEFNSLRNQMIQKSVDRHESSLEVLYRYYDQLCAVESKLPIAENQIRVNFKWQDAFDKESFFGGKRTLAISSGAYEKVCVLFNIAALQSQVAECQNHDSDDGLKQSAKLFQMSAGIFSYLKDHVLSSVPGMAPTPDIHPDALGALSALMVAQGQDCIYRKAVQGRMKDAITAKIAHQCSDLYADAMKLLQLQTLREMWPRDWINVVAGKQAGFHALAEFYQSAACKVAKNYGEELARLAHADELMSAAQNRGKETFALQDEHAKIRRSLEAAKKDNDFIYHERVPDVKNLTPIGKAELAKRLAISAPMSSRFTDLFEKLVPLNVHQALTAFENRKTELVNMEIGKMRESTQLLNGVLSSLNLPAAIEDLSGTRVPASVLEKAAKIREMGGVSYINKLMSELPELLQRNRELLDETIRLLDDEQASDKQLREQFKERWTRTPSEKLTDSIRAEGAKYRNILDNAIQADQVVQQKFGTHNNGITLLSKSDNDIQAALPSANPAAALKDSPVVQELRQLCEQVETIKAERDAMEAELQDKKCDMTTTFMAALAQDGALNEELLSGQELDASYGPLRQQVRDSIDRQESVMANVQRCNMQFCQAKESNQATMQRETLLKELAAAFDGYNELKGNLEEGTKFYNDLTQLLVKFQTKVSDLCFARKTEKDELMKDLQNAIAARPTQPAPQAPSYQQPTTPAPPTLPLQTPPPAAASAPSGDNSSEGSRQPPPRPPPPSRPPAPSRPPQPSTQGSQGPTAPNAPSAPNQPPPYGQPQQLPYPTQPQQQQYGQQPGQPPYPTYGAQPYAGYPQQGYAPMPMPTGYNPYAYGQWNQPQAPPQGSPYPTYPQHPGYPQYPQQQYPGQR